MSNRSTEGIMVESKKGNQTTFTDERGYFSIYVLPHDTLYYYVNKLARSIPYPVDSIKDWNAYAIAIQTIDYDIAMARKYGTPIDKVDASINLGNVTVTARNYHKDSLQNRLEYDKIFNYKNPPINPFSPVQTIYDLLSFKKKKRIKRMRKDLLFEEEQGYVDTRFNKTVVKRSIGKAIDDAVLDAYMRRYRPTYAQSIGMEDLSMVMYIRKTFKLYQDSTQFKGGQTGDTLINKK